MHTLKTKNLINNMQTSNNNLKKKNYSKWKVDKGTILMIDLVKNKLNKQNENSKTTGKGNC